MTHLRSKGAFDQILKSNLHCGSGELDGWMRFDVMKRIPAAYIIEKAISEGWVDSDTVVIETTSGSFGVGLAEVCCRYGVELHLVSDPAMEGVAAMKARALGATVHIIRVPDASGNFQKARLAMIQDLKQTYQKHFIPEQYDNPDNVKAYLACADHYLTETGFVPDVLIASVGSGGSSRGLYTQFSHANPDLALVGVDTPRSVLFGDQDGKRVLRGLGNSVTPKIFCPSIFAEVHWVSYDCAVTGALRLYRELGYFCGLTSGGVYLTHKAIRRRSPKARILSVFPDNGYRYTDDLADCNEALVSEQSAPDEITGFPDGSAHWSYRKLREKTHA
ncbi:MAG: pyridoxal-phosphate dependent enzyme [Hyphomicrobiales bacterium]